MQIRCDPLLQHIIPATVCGQACQESICPVAAGQHDWRTRRRFHPGLPRATTHNVRLQDSETVDRVVGRDRLLLVIEILDAMADFAAAPVRELAQAP